MSGPGLWALAGLPQGGGSPLTRALLGYRNANQDQFSAASTPSLFPFPGGVAGGPLSATGDAGAMTLDPITATASGPPGQRMPFGAPTPPVQPAAPNFWARLFGGVDPSQAGLLNPGQQNMLGRQGLLNLGMTLLSGNQAGRLGEFAPSTGQALAAGIQQGRTSYEQGGQQLLQRDILNARRGLAQALASGDPAQLRSAAGVLSALGQDDAAKFGLDMAKSVQGEWREATDPNTGRTFLYNTASGERRFAESATGQPQGFLPAPLREPFAAQSQQLAQAMQPYVVAAQGFKGVRSAFDVAGGGRSDPTPAAWNALATQVHTLVASAAQSGTAQPGLVAAVESLVGIGHPTAANVRQLNQIAAQVNSANQAARRALMQTHTATWHTIRGNISAAELPDYGSVFGDIEGPPPRQAIHQRFDGAR